VTATERLAVRIAGLLFRLRREHDGWWIHRTTSGRWLAIRGTTCLRAATAAQLRERLRRRPIESAYEKGGDGS
jgi:hypothetical protein